MGGESNNHRAHQILVRVQAWKIRRFGRDHQQTLHTEGYLATALRDLGRIDEAEEMIRELYATYCRVRGEEHILTMECGFQLIILLNAFRYPDGLEEARSLYRATYPRARRVLGPDHHITRRFQDPGLLQALGITGA